MEKSELQKRLESLAKDFIKSKLWEVLTDSDVFAVQLESGETAYCCIWLGIVVAHPLSEPTAIATHRVRVASAPLMNILAKVKLAVLFPFQNRVGHSSRTDGVICKTTLLSEQLEVLARQASFGRAVAIGRIKLKSATSYITNNCS